MFSRWKEMVSKAKAKRAARKKNRLASESARRDLYGGNSRDVVWNGTMCDARRSHPGGGPI